MSRGASTSGNSRWGIAPDRAVRLCMVIAGLAAVALGLWRLRSPESKHETPLPVLNIETFEPSVRESLETAIAAVRAQRRLAPAWGHLGMALCAYERFPDSKYCLAEAMRLDPTNAHWPYLLARVPFQNSSIEQEHLLARAIELAKDAHPQPRLRLAEVLAEAGRWEDMTRVLQPLASRGEEPAASVLLRARAAQSQGNLSAAIELARGTTQHATTRRAGSQLLAQLLRRAGDETAANEVLATVVTLPPDERPIDPWELEHTFERTDPRAASDAIQSLLAQGRLMEATARIDSVLRANPKFAEASLLKGRLEGLRGDAVAAERWILTHLELDKHSAQGWFQLGLARLKQERLDEADSAFKRAIELKSDFGAAHFNRALCLANLRRTNEAIASLEQSIRHNPEHFESYLHLSDLHFRAGNLDAGFARLHQARQLNPNDPRLRSLMERAGSRNQR